MMKSDKNEGNGKEQENQDQSLEVIKYQGGEVATDASSKLRIQSTD